MESSMNLHNTLLKYPIYVSDYIIHIYLVLNKFRPACLLESANIKDICKCDVDSIMNKMLKLAQKYGLYCIIENVEYKRYLITKKIINTENITEMQLGKLLDFRCYNHLEWSNMSIPRIGTIISGIYLDKYTFQIAQVCERSKITDKQIATYIKTTINKLKKILPDGFIFKSEILNM